jgi:esterase/lipase
MGILQGDDFLIEGKTFYVFDGTCPELILDKSEKEWLKTVWEKYSKLRRS